MHSQGLDLGKGPIFPLLLKMSWPSIIAMLAMALANLIDAFWLARLNTQALAALTVCFPIQMIFGAIGVGTGVGAGSYAARMFGANQILKARQTAGQVILLSAGLGILTIIPVSFAPDAILIFFGAHEDILFLARQYLLVIVWGSPFLYLLMTINNLLRAEGRPNLSMSVVLIFALVLMTLEPFVVFGWGPFPKLGIVGAALAAVIAQASAGILALIFLKRKTSKYELEWHHIRPRPSICHSIYQTGLPSVIMNLIFSLVMIVYNHVLSSFGPMALASLGICFRLNGLVTMILFGIGHGVMPLVAFNQGAGLHRRLIQTVSVAVHCSALFSGISSLLLILFAEPILGIITGDAALVAATTPALRLFILALVLVGPMVVWINMFIGLGKGTTAMLLMMFRDGFLLIPLLLTLPHLFGITGAWISQTISNSLAFLMILFLSARQIRRYR